MILPLSASLIAENDGTWHSARQVYAFLWEFFVSPLRQDRVELPSVV
jgi:hypothetical protein